MDYGKVAYEAYSAYTCGVSLVSGAKLPAWDALDLNIAVAWTSAAKAVLAARVASCNDGA